MAHWDDAGDAAGRPARWPRRLAFAALALAVFLVGSFALLMLAPPTGLVRDRLVAEVKAKTGRDLTIGGRVSLRVFPRLSVSMQDVALSAPPRMPGAPLVTAERLDLELEIMPLLLREVAVERLVIRRPVVALRIDADGRRSWDFASADDLRDGTVVRFAQAGQRGPDGRQLPRELQEFVRNSNDTATGKRPFSGINDISLGVVRVIDGTVAYSDARGSMSHSVTGIDSHLALRDIGGPLVATGKLVHAGEPVTFDFRVQSFRSVLDSQPTKATLKLAGKTLDMSFEGALAAGNASAADGRLVLTVPSLEALARKFALPVTGIDPLGAFAVDGQVELSGQSLALADGKLSLGSTAATGSLSVDIGAARPQVKANLRIATLDLDRFFALEPRLAAPSAEVAAPRPDPPPPTPNAGEARAGRFAPPVGTRLGPASSIEDLIQRSDGAGANQPAHGPAVRGYTRRAEEGWSSEPLNTAALRLFDLDGRFDLGRIAWANTAIGATQLAVQLKAGVLKLDIPQSALYGGTAKGLISVDARAPDLTIGANISGDGIAALPLLQALSAVDFLDGRGRLVLAVSARGGSERELIGTLAGKAELRLQDGALVGWDASQMIGGLGQGRIPKLDRAQGARTPFRELSGTFQIANGVARNQDLKVDAPSMRATGSGVINLVDRNLNMLVKPQVASAGAPGIEVPLRIAGPFGQVSVVPDVGSALKSPQAQEAAKKLREGDVEGAAREVLGGGPKADEKINRAKETLRQFLQR